MFKIIKIKKKCRKFPLFFALLLLFNINVLAAGYNSPVSTLTVEEAVERAILYSNSLKTLKENKELAEVDAKDTNTSLAHSTEYTDLTNLSVELKNLQNKIDNYTANEDITKQSIELSVIGCFASIINAENSLKLYEEQLDISKRELEISEVKAKLGLMSDTEYTTQKNSYNTTELNRTSLEIAIDNAYISLNEILGYDLNTKYEIELDIEYEPLGEVNVDTVINKALSSSQTIKEKDDAVTVAKYRVDVYSSMYSNETKESVDVNYSQATRDLTDAKTNMKINITNTYNSIVSLENSYETNQMELDEMKSQLSVNEKKLELGTITQLDLDNYKYQMKSLNNTIQGQIYEHYILVQKFKNPDLI